MQSVTLPLRGPVPLEIKNLEGDLINPYNEIITNFGQPAQSRLKILDRRGDNLRGSNGFSPIILGDFISLKSRLARTFDVMEALKIDQRFLKTFYTDLGLVLRTPGDSKEYNDLIAKDLASQFNNRGIGLKAPLVIYFDALELRENRDSAYGLSYVLSDKAELGKNVIEAPEFFSPITFTTVNEQGIPIPDETGTKKMHVRGDGLSILCWGMYNDLNSDFWNLGRSTHFGRTLVVREKRAA